MSENVTTAITILDPERAIGEVNALYSIMTNLYKNVLKPNLDYGIIPGTGDKPTLLLPGMEKLMRALNAVPRYVERRAIVDYDTPLFHYEYECQLIDASTGQFIPGGIGLGLCTSMESSFRWRKAERMCPNCNTPNIRKSKNKPEWYCWSKMGGCGATFPENDSRITEQVVGRVENPDIFDQVNAIMKRAKKRALGDAVKGAAAVSELFTVDVEDFEIPPLHDEIIIEQPKPMEPVPGQQTDSTQPANGKVRPFDMPTLAKMSAFLYDNDFEREASMLKHMPDGDEPLYDKNDSNSVALSKLLAYKAQQKFDMTTDDIRAALDMGYQQWLKAGHTPEEAWEILKLAHEYKQTTTTSAPAAKSEAEPVNELDAHFGKRQDETEIEDTPF